MPTAAASIRREHVEAFIAAELARTAPSSAATRYRSLQQLFKWLDDEGEIAGSPMAKMRPPIIPGSRYPFCRMTRSVACLPAVPARSSAIDVSLARIEVSLARSARGALSLSKSIFRTIGTEKIGLSGRAFYYSRRL